jgi:hypothetical protein
MEKVPKRPTLLFLFGALCLSAHLALAQFPDAWQPIARIRDQRSHVVPAFWQELPKLDARSRVKVLDVDGPGVVSVFHCSSIATRKEGIKFALEKYASANVTLRVFYDHEAFPSIEMPLMDFFADIQSTSAYFSTVYFSKVRESHNFHLPMPFRKHITIEVENPLDVGLWAYCDIQWEQVENIADDIGYLRTDFRTGTLDPKVPTTVADVRGRGSIVAHWLQFENEKSYADGDLLCEGNQEVYLDGDTKPTLDYLGTEDAYGFSWAFRAVAGDQYVAIVKRESLKPTGMRIAAVRCRANDMISFKESCKWVISYLHDPAALDGFGTSLIPYRHCVYYYAK